MGDLELRAGRWFATGSSRVSGVREYHAEHLSWPLPKARPRGADPPPEPPPCLEIGWDQNPKDLSPRQKRDLARRVREWAEKFDAWLRRTKTTRAPAPPRTGSVILAAPGPVPGFTDYEVGPHARKALARLREVATAACATRADGLVWAAQEYARLRRRGRFSVGEVIRDQALVVEASSELGQATKELLSARAAPNAARLKKAEARWGYVRDGLASAVAEVERTSADSESALAVFCLEEGEKGPVRAKVEQFVSEFGPLILDFGAWCSDTEYGAFVRHHPVSASDMTSHLLQLGHERFLWPRQWRKWATESYGRSMCCQPTPTVPAPIGFYVWAACMLTALSDHPEWPGCRLFLANRLASLRLLEEESWDPWLVERLKPHQGRRLSARLHGELLDYLALAAGYRSSPARASEEHTETCKICRRDFRTGDHRFRHCEKCRKQRKILTAARQQHYREHHKNRAV